MWRRSQTGTAYARMTSTTATTNQTSRRSQIVARNPPGDDLGPPGSLGRGRGGAGHPGVCRTGLGSPPHDAVREPGVQAVLGSRREAPRGAVATSQDGFGAQCPRDVEAVVARPLAMTRGTRTPF